MRFLFRIFLVLLAAGGVVADAVAADITALRSWRAPDNTRIVLDLSGPVSYRLSPDSTPARLIVEIDDARLSGPIALPGAAGPVKGMHFEAADHGQRLVIDTSLELVPKVFQLPPNEKYGHRLVVDLFDKPALVLADKAPSGDKAEVRTTPEKPVETPPAAAVVKPVPEGVAPSAPVLPEKPKGPPAVVEKPAPVVPAAPERPEAAMPAAPERPDGRRYRNVIVAIDAGHGGEDPGASGARGTHEKDVTLAIARELEAQFRTEPGITPVLTRSGDYFIPLQDRRRIARYQLKADIFVSVHADAAPSRAASGASVFALSLKGANTATSRFARMLAERENRSDLIGGAAIETGDDVLRNVLADMVVAGSLEHSLRMGRNILARLDDIGGLHSHRVEQAGFAVLKEPGMVSLLVETGFISNPDEENKLTNKHYQHELARAIFDGVRRYCVQYPAPGTYFAWLADKGRDRVADARVVRDPAPAADGGQAVADSPRVPADTRKSARARFLRHKVARGESLTRLAAHYQVSMNTLREVNGLRDDNVKIGQVLKIPAN